ncbi:MAG: hypothetical protein R6U98_05625, partial [Pirellulaceae bacterium]
MAEPRPPEWTGPLVAAVFAAAMSTVSTRLNSAATLSMGKNYRDYISGGGICPDGKLPDASRPPVGRTRGTRSHPRP